MWNRSWQLLPKATILNSIKLQIQQKPLHNSWLSIFWISDHAQNNWRRGSGETMNIPYDILLFPRSLVFSCFVYGHSTRISKLSYFFKHSNSCCSNCFPWMPGIFESHVKISIDSSKQEQLALCENQWPNMWLSITLKNSYHIIVLLVK